jgi:hypothetical protein
MGKPRFIDKFIDCARYASRPIGAERARQICDAALTLESLQDVARDLMPLLQGDAGVARQQGFYA